MPPLSKKKHKLLLAAKRRRQTNAKVSPKKTKVTQEVAFEDDEEISSSSSQASEDEIEKDEDNTEAMDELDDAEETVETKRLRLAREYLDSQRGDNDGEEEENDQALGARLAVQRESENSFVRVAERFKTSLMDQCISSAIRLKPHRGSVTCCCLGPQRVYSGSKDNSLYEHDIETGRLVREIIARWPRSWIKQGETLADHQAREAEILAVAVSSDGRCLAAAGSDSLVHLWDIRKQNSQPIISLSGHRGRIAALAFQKNTTFSIDSAVDDSNQWFSKLVLFSGGDDAVVRHWQGGKFLEALYGHEAPVRALDCAAGGPLSTGADRTVRSWKLRDETHLVYRPKIKGPVPLTSVDSCSLLSDVGGGNRTFLTGGDDGALSLWNTKRKKPIAYVPNAHGTGYPQATSPRWISALTAWSNSDLCFSGSCDGFLRLWRITENNDDLLPVQQISIPGYINAICLPSRSDNNTDGPPFVAVAAAREHRLGRWGATIKSAPNAVLILPLLNSSS